VKIATFNVNSIKVRLPILLDWLQTAQPDVVCLQEIKCLAADFPALELKGLGYNAEVLGQKTYNGVALLSKEPARDVLRGLPGNDGDEQARYLEASFGDLRVASLYLPNQIVMII
jgi:exodeoxyribonuclease-3